MVRIKTTQRLSYLYKQPTDGGTENNLHPMHSQFNLNITKFIKLSQFILVTSVKPESIMCVCVKRNISVLFMLKKSK